MSTAWRKKILIWLAALAGAALIVGAVALLQRGSRELVVTFFDVGQGDAALIRSPGGESVLVDGGPSTAVLPKVGSALPFYDRSIDLVILTHCHADHAVGLVPIVERYRVGRLLMPRDEQGSASCRELTRVATERGVPIELATAGQSFTFSGAQLSILYPAAGDTGLKGNSSSTVAQLRYGSASFLFTGDAPVSVEDDLIARYDAGTLRSNVLKVGHHASRYSTSSEFLGVVHPWYAVVSVGAKNTYGHPHRSVLEQLKRTGVPVYRTDQVGDVTFTSNGSELNVAVRNYP
ncbi:MAG: ComEC/Rec2 family competence protein [Patescibacteria group bacterium]